MKVITVCGSLKYQNEMMNITEILAKQGNCMLTPVYLTGEYNCSDKEKELLKKEHFEKIKLSDSILVVNVDNYIGESTAKEIEYAKSLGKEILYYTDFKIEEGDIEFNSLIPELSVSNIETSIKFYKDLGFKIIYERPENKFCFIQLEDNQIMLEEKNNNWNVGKLEYPYGNGINISMKVKDVQKKYNELKKKNIIFFLDIEVHEYKVNNKIYKDSEFLLQDPDGYLLRFNN